MNSLTTFATYEFGILLTALFGVVMFRMLTGHINMRGLLSAKETGGGVSPARVQALIATLNLTFYLLAKLLSKQNGVVHFPEVPAEALLLISGSQGFYLVSKAQRTALS